MSMWTSFKKWALAPEKDSIMELAPKTKYDSMVGEPVISFLESLEREPKRYKLESLSECEYTGDVYHWMNESGLHKLTDTKHGTEYPAYIHGKVLYSVSGLPFDLNHWELKAIYTAFVELRRPARIRRERIREAAYQRERDKQVKKELEDRLQYAQRFK